MPRATQTMTIPFDTLRLKWMKDLKFRAQYERIGPEMELAMTLADARRKAGLALAELAVRMKASQAAVARIESNNSAPKWIPSNATPAPLAHGRSYGCSTRGIGFPARSTIVQLLIVFHKNSMKDGGCRKCRFEKIPCYFPCSQGMKVFE
jgi:hypothetical protein